MGKSAVASVIALVCLMPQAWAQTISKTQKPLATWNIHTPDTMVEGRSPYPVGVMTPMKSIVIRRLEALSNKGPSAGTLATGEPIPCPVQYALELTNSAVTWEIPISNTFLTNKNNKKTSQTYTDSGPINLWFSAGNRIVLSMIAPKPQFPPVSCFVIGLDITIQYELADDVAPKASSADRNP